MFHRSSQSKLPCCFLDSQHPLFWYLTQGQWSSLAAKSYPKWEKTVVESNWKKQKEQWTSTARAQKQSWACQDESKYFPEKTVLVLPQLTKSMKLSHSPPTSPACKEVTQQIPEQDKRGVEGHRDNWQTYFLIRNGPEPSTTSQSSLFDSLETSPSL